jgi:hypothetical protein
VTALELVLAILSAAAAIWLYRKFEQDHPPVYRTAARMREQLGIEPIEPRDWAENLREKD